MTEVCHRSGQKVYAADRPVRIGGMVFHPGHFTCKFFRCCRRCYCEVALLLGADAYPQNVHRTRA